MGCFGSGKLGTTARAGVSLAALLAASAPWCSARAAVQTADFNDATAPVYYYSAALPDYSFNNPFFQLNYLYPAFDPVLQQQTNSRYLAGYSDGVLETGGLRFSGGHFHTVDNWAAHGSASFGGAPDNGTIYLNAERGVPISLAASDGATFALLEFDAAENFANVEVAALDGYPTAVGLQLTGERADGSTLSLWVPLDGVNDASGPDADFETVVLPAEWAGLVSVTFAGLEADLTPGGFSLDNVTLDRDRTAVAVAGRSLLVNGTAFTVRGVRYSPVPVGDDPTAAAPWGDYFTGGYAPIHERDLPLLRALGANALFLPPWDDAADHGAFLDAAYNGGTRPLYVVPEFRVPGGADLDPASPGNVREALKAQFRALVASHGDHPAVLLWSIGSDLDTPDAAVADPSEILSLVAELAAEAHAEEGGDAHPVLAPLDESRFADLVASWDYAMGELDLWGLAGAPDPAALAAAADACRAAGDRPLLAAAFGIDAYDDFLGEEYELSGGTDQADAAESWWQALAGAADVCVGGAVREFRDQWWRGGLSGEPGCAASDPAAHDACGSAAAGHPDGYDNEEWWGLMRVADPGADPDTLEPRAAYGRLQGLWRPHLTLEIDEGRETTGSALVALALGCRDEEACVQVQFSNDGAAWSDPVPFAPAFSWAIAAGSDGPRTVSARIADGSGAWSAAVSDGIVLDTTAPATSASPAGGIFAVAQSVALSCTDGGGAGCDRTYYTTDGSAPTTSSAVYAAPIGIAASATLRFFSTDRSGHAEAVRSETYTIDGTPPTGTILIAGGAPHTNYGFVSLALDCTDDSGCSQMQFSNDGVSWSTPGGYNPTRSWALSPGDGPKTVSVMFRDAAENWSAPVSDSILLDTHAPLTGASPAGGTYAAAQAVTLACADDGGTGCDRTYYTTDGSTPTTASTVYAGPIAVAASATLRFFSTDAAGNAEAVRSAAYAIDPVPPTGSVSIAGGAAYASYGLVELTLACDDESGCAQVRLSNDGTTWSAPSGYSATRFWSLSAGDGPKTVSALFSDAAGNWSAPASDSILLDTRAPATGADPAGGGFAAAQAVSLACDDGGGAGCDGTYYTTDGSTPTTSSTVYAGPIAVAATTTLRFFSTDAAGNAEAVRTEVYAIDGEPPTGAVEIAGGAPHSASSFLQLALSCADAGSGCDRMRLSNDGTAWSDPMDYAASRTWTLAPGDGPKTVFAVFSDGAGNWSAAESDTIFLDTHAPWTVARPFGEAFPTPQSVTLSCADRRGTGCDRTYYTTDGSAPTTDSTVYAGPIAVATTTTVRYFSTDAAGNAEPVRTRVFTIDGDPPSGTVTIAGGAPATTTGFVSLALTCDDGAGACDRMRFSNDGVAWSDPLEFVASRHWTLATGDGPKTVYALFGDAAGNWSAAAEDGILLDTRAPLTGAAPAGGAYGSPQAVTLTCTDAGSGCDRTYYTTDGSAPTTSSAVYAAPLAIDASLTLRYFSTDAAGNAESLRSQTYTIGP